MGLNKNNNQLIQIKQHNDIGNQLTNQMSYAMLQSYLDINSRKPGRKSICGKRKRIITPTTNGTVTPIIKEEGLAPSPITTKNYLF